MPTVPKYEKSNINVSSPSKAPITNPDQPQRSTSLPSSLTQLMGSGEGRRKPIVLDDRAASLGITHGTHISHAQGVTGGSPTEVLPDGGEEEPDES